MLHSHAYIVSSPSIDTAFDRALTMAAESIGNPEKVRKENHPDVRVIRKGEDKAKTEISVSQVREVIADSVILPNEANGKVYIFRDGDAMNESAQNAALKLLEEPPKGVTIILCATRADAFLQTVRSRCIEINCGIADGNGPEDGLAVEFIKTLAGENAKGRLEFCEANSSMGIPEMKAFCAEVCSVTADILTSRRQNPGIATEKLLRLEALMKKCLRYLDVNVNVKQIIGLLEIFE